MPRAGAAARKQEKLALQSEAKSAARESHQPRVVDACCAKVMNEFVKSSRKPPTLRDIRQVIQPKVNAERQLQKKPPILESTRVTHIRKWKQSAGYTWPGRKHQKTDDDSPDLRCARAQEKVALQSEVTPEAKRSKRSKRSTKRSNERSKRIAEASALA